MIRMSETDAGSARALLRGAALAFSVGLAAGCAGGSAADRGAPAPAPSTEDGVAAPAPASEYQVYVANESSDRVSRVAYAPDGGVRVANDIPVGIMPADLDGAHGLKVSPDDRYWYVSLAHGTPFGKVWKFDAGADTLAGEVEVGRFPASMALTGTGEFLFVVNFNLHGDPEPSSVSVVHTPTMTEVARPTTCVKPHGSRMNASGTKHYSACNGSDQLVEIDATSFEVTHRFDVTPGERGSLPLDDVGETPGGAGEPCGPTWVTPGTGPRADRTVYVACNAYDEVLEIDVEDWRVSRRFPTGAGPYNLDITPDGRLLVASLKGDRAVAVIDLDAGEEVARIPTTQPITHGVAVSRDGRYAFISNEAVGGTPGTIDVIDLERLERVDSVEVGYQPGGIDIWSPAR